MNAERKTAIFTHSSHRLARILRRAHYKYTRILYALCSFVFFFLLTVAQYFVRCDGGQGFALIRLRVTGNLNCFLFNDYDFTCNTYVLYCFVLFWNK